MYPESRNVQALTRALANVCKPLAMMTLAELDRLCETIDRAVTTEPAAIDLITLQALATDVDEHRRVRRLSLAGHVSGQLDFDGNELAA